MPVSAPTVRGRSGKWLRALHRPPRPPARATPQEVSYQPAAIPELFEKTQKVFEALPGPLFFLVWEAFLFS